MKYQGTASHAKTEPLTKGEAECKLRRQATNVHHKAILPTRDRAKDITQMRVSSTINNSVKQAMRQTYNFLNKEHRDFASFIGFIAPTLENRFLRD